MAFFLNTRIQLMLVLVLPFIQFMNTSFISDTIIDNEYSELGIMDIKPSTSNRLVISKTCVNNSMDDDFPVHLESSINFENHKINRRDKRSIFGFFAFILTFVNAILAVNLNININNNNNNNNNNNMNNLNTNMNMNMK